MPNVEVPPVPSRLVEIITFYVKDTEVDRLSLNLYLYAWVLSETPITLTSLNSAFYESNVPVVKWSHAFFGLTVRTPVGYLGVIFKMALEWLPRSVVFGLNVNRSRTRYHSMLIVPTLLSVVAGNGARPDSHIPRPNDGTDNNEIGFITWTVGSSLTRNQNGQGFVCLPTAYQLTKPNHF